MRENFTDITVILDRSGSMSGIKKDTLGGFNSFVQGQQEAGSDCVFSLIQFDNQYEIHYTARPIENMRPLTSADYVPRGSTALLDAVGRTINAIGKRLEDTPESDRPGKVVVVIITDGYENASKEFTKAQIKSMIELQEDVYKWEFIFLGANMDAVAEGTSMGYKTEKSMTWATNSVGIANTYEALNMKVSAYRAGAKMEFDEADRLAASAGV